MGQMAQRRLGQPPERRIMQEAFEKMKQRIRIAATNACEYTLMTKVVSEEELKNIIDDVAAGYNNGWIPCSERMPENEQEVGITYIRRDYKTGETLYLTARAFYEDGTLTTEDSGYGWGETDNWKYCEEKDACIIPERWYEGVSFTEEFGIVDMPVIAWRPLLEPYQPNAVRPKKTNFDRCCESMEAMAQIIDIAKTGWTKDQIMEWLQSEAEE